MGKSKKDTVKKVEKVEVKKAPAKNKKIVVAPGASITSKRGILSPGTEVKDTDFACNIQDLINKKLCVEV